MMNELGFISIHNEDGFQWLSKDSCWGPSGKIAHALTVFQKLQGEVEQSTARNCPDNGFFGLMNLTWHPCTQEEADAAEKVADGIWKELADEDAEFDARMREVYGAAWDAEPEFEEAL